MGDWLDEMVDDEDIEDELEEDFCDCMCDMCQNNYPDLEDEDE